MESVAAQTGKVFKLKKEVSGWFYIKSLLHFTQFSPLRYFLTNEYYWEAKRVFKNDEMQFEKKTFEKLFYLWYGRMFCREL